MACDHRFYFGLIFPAFFPSAYVIARATENGIARAATLQKHQELNFVAKHNGNFSAVNVSVLQNYESVKIFASDLGDFNKLQTKI